MKRPTIRVIEVKCRMINGRSAGASIFHSDQSRHKLLRMSTEAGKTVSYGEKYKFKRPSRSFINSSEQQRTCFRGSGHQQGVLTRRGGLVASAQSTHWFPLAMSAVTCNERRKESSLEMRDT